MNRQNKEKKIRWSVLLRSKGEVDKLTDCLQNLVKAVSASKTEVILIYPNIKHADVHIKLCEHFCESEGIDFSYMDSEGDVLSLAIENAKGEFIVFLNEDTVVSKNFLSRLSHAYENFPIDYNFGPIGCVVPVSNVAPGRQKLTLPKELLPSSVEAIQGTIESNLTDKPDSLKWVISGVASDFCMLVPKKVIESVGLLNSSISDEVTRGTDYVLRLLTNNYYTILCGNVYAYRNCPEVRTGPQIPVDSPPEREEKLGFLFKVKIDTEYLLEIFIHSLKRVSTIADGIFVLDEGSKIKLGLTLKDREPELWSKITKYDKTFQARDDKAAYNKLLDWAEEAGMTWTFSLESGETIEGRIDRAYFERLMHPINPIILCYTSNEFYFWDDVTTWRSDGYWGKVNSVRFSRLIPGHRLMGNDTLSSQCGYVAPFPPEVIRPMNLRIKCYNLVNEEHRVEAYKRATTMAKGQNWNHILDSEGIVSYPWRNDITVSVYSPTNKGGEELKDWVDHVWSWSDEIVIGNDCSQLKPEDLAMLKVWGVKVVPCIMGDNYSKGRNMILEQCTQDHIFQMDIDERLTEPMVIFRMLCTDHDAWMFSIDNWQKDGGSIVTETARLFRNKNNPQYWGYLHETIDDFMRTNRLKVGLSPVRLSHYGYLNMTPQGAWTKMQRYMRINLKQMEDFPRDSRSYYNLALHLVEDGLVEDAMKLLITSCYLSGGQVLSVAELAKLHVQRSFDLFNLVGSSQQGGSSALHVKEYGSQMAKALAQLRPQHQIVAQGHARAFFETDPELRLWLYRHLKHVEETIIYPRQDGVTPAMKNEEEIKKNIERLMKPVKQPSLSLVKNVQA